MLKADINVSAAGDSIVIGLGVGQMPAAWENSGECIAIDHINLIVSGATTLQFKDGALTDATNGTVPQANYGGAYALQQGQAIVLENAMQHNDGVMMMGANKSFVINSTSAVQVSGFIRYRRLNTN